FAVAEQAINTIYLLGEHSDILCGEIIKHKTASVFDLKIPKADDMETIFYRIKNSLWHTPFN
ncbi:832_t:CDS:1, partial [Gigaspora rosea]